MLVSNQGRDNFTLVSWLFRIEEKIRKEKRERQLEEIRKPLFATPNSKRYRDRIMESG